MFCRSTSLADGVTGMAKKEVNRVARARRGSLNIV